MRRKIKVLSLLVCSTFIIGSLASCTKNEPVQMPSDPSVQLQTVYSSTDADEAKKNVFRGTNFELYSVNGSSIDYNCGYGIVDSSLCVVSVVTNSADDSIPFLAVSIEESNGDFSSNFLDIPDEKLFVPTEIVELVEETITYNDLNNIDDEYRNEDYYVSVGYSGFEILEDGCIEGIVEYSYSFYSSSENKSVSTTERQLCKWNKSCELLWNENVRDKAVDEYVFYNNSFMVGQNYAIISSINNDNTALTIWDSNGNVIKNEAIDASAQINDILNVIKVKSGKYVAFYVNSEDLLCATYIDASNGNLSGSISLPNYLSLNGYMSITEGASSDIVFSDHLGIYSCNIDSDELTVLMDYANSDFNGYYVDYINVVDNYNFYGVYSDLDYHNDTLAKFTGVNANAIEDRALVVLGSYKLSSVVRKQIRKYNTENEVYRIIVKEYSYYDEINDRSKGCRMLEEDITAGNTIDLTSVDIGRINTYSLAVNGCLVSMSYLVGEDTEFSTGDILQNVIDAYSINGIDYIMVYDFMYRTFLGNASIVGNNNSWGVSDLKKTLGKAPSGNGAIYIYNTQQNYLDKLIKFDASEFIDYENAKCSFNSSEFIDLLKIGANLPESSDETLDIFLSASDSYRNGDILLKEANVIKADAFWKDAYRLFDGNATLVGFPSTKGTSSIVEYVNTPIMIISTGNIAGAWSFAKTFYSYEFQSSINNAIPVSKTAFDVWGKNAIADTNYSSVNELGESYTYQSTYYYNGNEYMIPFITDENVEAIKSTIEKTTKAAFNDDTIEAIINEEVQKIFAGSQTAKQAADNINSRVTVYLFN